MLEDFLMRVAGLLIAVTTISHTGGVSPLKDLAQAATPVRSAFQQGSCEKEYDRCRANPQQKNKQICETNWRTCVSKKCTPSITSKAPLIISCPRDLDCERSCTESGSSTKGLLSCCEGGPKHNNSCPKKIDGKCVPPGTSFEEPKPNEPLRFGEPTYGEGEVIPLKDRIGEQIPDTDPRIIIPPSYPLQYPEGTVFDESGLPSNPPLPNSQYTLTEIQPYDYMRYSLYSSPEEQLPPEYRPDIPYVPSEGERINIDYKGAQYSVPKEAWKAWEISSQLSPVYSSKEVNTAVDFYSGTDTFGDPEDQYPHFGSSGYENSTVMQMLKDRARDIWDYLRGLF